MDIECSAFFWLSNRFLLKKCWMKSSKFGDFAMNSIFFTLFLQIKLNSLHGMCVCHSYSTEKEATIHQYHSHFVRISIVSIVNKLYILVYQFHHNLIYNILFCWQCQFSHNLSLLFAYAFPSRVSPIAHIKYIEWVKWFFFVHHIW